MSCLIYEIWMWKCKTLNVTISEIVYTVIMILISLGQTDLLLHCNTLTKCNAKAKSYIQFACLATTLTSSGNTTFSPKSPCNNKLYHAQLYNVLLNCIILEPVGLVTAHRHRRECTVNCTPNATLVKTVAYSRMSWRDDEGLDPTLTLTLEQLMLIGAGSDSTVTVCRGLPLCHQQLHV